MAVQICSPLTGRAVAFSEVPDPVFSGGFLGPGLAIDPERKSQEAVAPVSGVIASMMPHAYGIRTADGTEVLVHLGIDTVKLEGKGFDVYRAQGDEVQAGDVILTWNPSEIEAGGRSPMAPVIALQVDPGACRNLVTEGQQVTAGQPLYEIG